MHGLCDIEGEMQFGPPIRDEHTMFTIRDYIKWCDFKFILQILYIRKSKPIIFSAQYSVFIFVELEPIFFTKNAIS